MIPGDRDGPSAAAPEVADLLRRLERVETELALHRLARDYCIGADHRDEERWAGVWTQDAVWETGPDRVFRGHAEITRGVVEQWRTFPLMQHACVNHTVESVDGDRAQGRSDVVVMVQVPDGTWVVGGGTYEDEYRRDGDTWRIALRRVVRPFDLAPLPSNDGPYRFETGDEPGTESREEPDDGSP